MTTNKLKQYINKVLGNSIRCLLPSYWWKRLFGLVVDKIAEVDGKIAALPTKKYVDDKISNSISGSTIDYDMSDTSTNPVQNRAIKKYVDDNIEGNIFHVGINADTRAVYLSEEDINNNRISYSKIKNNLFSKVTISFYMINPDGTNKRWFYSDTFRLCFHKYFLVPSVNNICLTDFYGSIFFLNQPIDVLFGEDGTVEIISSTGFATPTMLFLENLLVGQKEHNIGVYNNLKRDSDYSYNAIFIIDTPRNAGKMSVLPATLLKVRNSSLQNDISIYIEVTKNNYIVKYELNADGTLTEINSTIDIDIPKYNYIIAKSLDGTTATIGDIEVTEEPTIIELNDYVLFNDETSNYPQNIEWIDLSNIDTRKAYSTAYMFNNMKNLITLDVSKFVTNKINNMQYMFYGCENLETLDLSKFNTKNVYNMSSMFARCSKLKTLNLSSFNLSSLTNNDYMFNYCNELKTLILGKNFFKTNLTSFYFYYQDNWTDESVITSLVTNSYDRTANGLPVMTLTLSSATKAVLTEEHIAAITAKGYIV